MKEHPFAQLQRLVVAPAQFHDRQIVLTPEQQHYLNRVLRLQVGDRFVVMNGCGQGWLAELLPLEAVKGYQAQLLEAIAMDTELPIHLTLVAALPKGNGFDEVVRQATELGVSDIVPVISDRTLLQPSPQKRNRWRRIAQEAAEQSERQRVPRVVEPIMLTAYLHSLSSSTRLNAAEVADHATRRYLGVTRQVAPDLLACLLKEGEALQLRQIQEIVMAIGPEGGWSDAEVAQAIAVGFQPVSLGKRILRTVTAPLAAIALIAAVLENEKGG
jgi:16S rRNA (uracil1498-N3)-methyltransferase